MKSITLAVVVLFITLFGYDYATGQIPQVYSVGPSGQSGYNFSSIQTAINNCVSGDRVVVYDGTYSSHTYIERIDFSGKNIKVEVARGHDVTIDGSQGGSVVTFDNGEGQYAVLDGFTITNGSSANGGGIYIYEADPTIENCTIIDNEATTQGGGIAVLHGSEPYIDNCTIIENVATTQGGGIASGVSNPYINNCTIEDNSCEEWGGGIYIGGDGTSATIDGCTIENNTATSACCSAGGGVMLDNGGADFEDCNILYNQAASGAGLYLAPQDSGNPLYITDCDIYDNGDIEDTICGGGIYLIGHYSHQACYFSIDSNKIYGNSAEEGAGVFFESVSNDYTPSDFINNFIYENVAEKGGAFYSYETPDFLIFNNTCADNEADYGGGCYAALDSEITFVNAIFWDTEANEEMYGPGDIYATYSDIYMTSGVYPGTGNINDDPDFTSPGLDRYTIVYGSPCIDQGDDPTGVPDHDFEGDSRPYNYIYDIGADEYVP